jgi:hypothetical protein
MSAAAFIVIMMPAIMIMIVSDIVMSMFGVVLRSR